MITAIEANEKRTELIDNCKTHNLTKINDRINEAIENGRNYITYKYILSKEENKKLKSLGYDVKCIRFSFWYERISW